MTELQKARADWIEAHEQILKLQKELSDSQHQCYELRMKLMVAEFRATTAEAFLKPMARAFVTG